MKNIPFLIILLFCTGCWGWANEKCMNPDCEYSTEFRFNLIDASGEDVVFDESHKYEVSDIKIVDQHGGEYLIKRVEFSRGEVLIVDLNGHVNQYELLLDGNIIDTFTVSFRETKEECCGKTYWIDNVSFSSLQTSISSDDTGSLHIKIN